MTRAKTDELTATDSLSTTLIESWFQRFDMYADIEIDESELLVITRLLWTFIPPISPPVWHFSAFRKYKGRYWDDISAHVKATEDWFRPAWVQISVVASRTKFVRQSATLRNV